MKKRATMTKNEWFVIEEGGKMFFEGFENEWDAKCAMQYYFKGLPLKDRERILTDKSLYVVHNFNNEVLGSREWFDEINELIGIEDAMDDIAQAYLEEEY